MKQGITIELMDWSTADILKATQGRLRYGKHDACFTGVCIDSRSISAGQLFVAICGDNHDAHTFIDQVVDKNVGGVVIQSRTAVALDHERYEKQGVSCFEVPDTTIALGALAAYQRRQHTLPVVAITGSNGKTSTRQMTQNVLSQRFNTLGTLGNFNNEIGLPLTLFNLAPEHTAAVVELGMNHPGEMTRLGAICHPTIAIITNVGPAHLEFLGSLEAVARAKGEIMAQVADDGTVVLNRDDPYVAALAIDTDRNVLWFGIDEQAAVRATQIVEDGTGVTFDLHLPTGTATVHLQTPGRFMVSNALAAAAAGYLTGLSVTEVKTGLQSFTATPGRLYITQTANGISIIDDTYNANPASMAAAINTLNDVRKDQTGIAVLGDMLELGAQAAELHQQVGRQAAASGVFRLYAFGRYAQKVLQGAWEAGMDQGNTFAGSKEAIIADLIHCLEPGCWVLIKGSRGNAMETVVTAIRQWADAEPPKR